MHRSSDIIDSTIHRAEGAYNTGAETLVHLESDSERITRAREKMGGIRDRMGEARRMLRRIEGRLTVNKLMKVTTLLFTLYLKFIMIIVGSNHIYINFIYCLDYLFQMDKRNHKLTKGASY